MEHKSVSRDKQVRAHLAHHPEYLPTFNSYPFVNRISQIAERERSAHLHISRISRYIKFIEASTNGVYRPIFDYRRNI